VDVGDHLGAGIAERGPRLPGFREEVQIFDAVDTQPRPLSEGGWLDEPMLAGRKAREQPVGSLGLLGGFLHDAAHQEELRIVAPMPFGVDGLHTLLLCKPISVW